MVQGGVIEGGGMTDDDKLVSTMYFASDVRSAEMTHAIWRGNVSFEIGGVSYVHGVNMQIADDGMSVAFTGENKPTKRAVVEALGEASDLSMILNANQLDAEPTSKIDSNTWEYAANVPVAPCSVGASFQSVGTKFNKHRYDVDIYTNSVSTGTHLFNYGENPSRGSYEKWVDFANFSAFGSNMIVRWKSLNVYIEVSWIIIRFLAFTYTREFNVTSIE